MSKIRASFNLMLNKDVMGQLVVQLRVKKDMEVLAMGKGYGPEELQNLLGQVFSEITEDVEMTVDRINYNHTFSKE